MAELAGRSDAASMGVNVEVDSQFSNVEDSGIESGDSSATTSVASSVFSYVYANGRRYHSDRFRKAEYFMPNDELEQERLDLFHHIFLRLKGGRLYTAPLDNPQSVLDVGTGTGIWAIDFADENPQARVIGTDISPIQPSWVPDNLQFEVDDCEEEWTYPDSSFDYIHLRSLSGSILDWSKLFRQCYNKLQPGGYIEFQDYCCDVYLNDGTLLEGTNTGHPVATYFHHTVRAAEKNGRTVQIAKDAKRLIEEAGFVDVVQTKEIWPIGEWPKDKELKELGRWIRFGAVQSAYPFAVALLTKEGWPVEQVKQLCDDVINSYKKGGARYYLYAWFIYGRKLEEKKNVTN